MTQAAQLADQVPGIGHDEAMQLAEAENARLLGVLRGLAAEQWAAPTDCSRWTVRDIAVHLIAMAQAQTSPVELARQLLAGRRLTAQIGGPHWADGLNEAQLRARRQGQQATLPDRWRRHSATALKVRRWMPAPIRALPLLPLGTALDVTVGWQPLGYLFDMGFTGTCGCTGSTSREPRASSLSCRPGTTGGSSPASSPSGPRGMVLRCTLTLTGPAGGEFRVGPGGEPQVVDAVEFVRILSGRAAGPGVLRHKLPL